MSTGANLLHMIWNNAKNILALKKKLVGELVEIALIVSSNVYLYIERIYKFKVKL